MRIVRFSPGPDAGLGTDPLFGILDEDNLITIIDGDPIYQGIVKTAARIELTKVRLLAPVIPRSKVVAIGKNYADHAAEMGGVVPDEPIIFLKANTTIIGPW
jgi:2-keto-4-pentenoate hydratase/2-oxohepta-3-ene-1,7-dioic acid hydratase in catechol pathway